VGSMRNPVGPLPSSIYWRRRAVALCVLALLALLILWAVNSGGSGGKGNGANGSGGHTPATSITPGPSATGPLNSSRPGGSVGGDSGSGGSGSGDSGGTSSGGSGGTTATAGSSAAGTTGGDTGSAGSSGTGGTSSGGAVQLPAGSSLPDCTSTGVTLTLRSVRNSYDPGVKPKFSLAATNANGTACKLDFGATAAVFTITDVSDNHVWASDDCPSSRSAYLVQVPANGKTAYVAQWDRESSSPKCATPKGQAAAAGTYLVEAKLPGFAAKQTSFVLSAS
jgi:hypothetical protein